MSEIRVEDLLRRKEIPERKELVVIRITKLTPYGVFCDLLEYEGVKGFVPITEVSRKRIKKLTDAVNVGMITVGYVQDVREEDKSVDISIRRVSESERKKKLNEYKLEKRIANIIYIAGKKAREKDEEISFLIGLIRDNYKSLQDFVESYRKRPEIIEEFRNSISNEFLEELKKALDEYVSKLKEKYRINIGICDFSRDGAKKIKETLINLKKDMSRIVENVCIEYNSAPEWYLFFETADIKEKSQKIKEILDKYAKECEKKGIYFEYEIVKK